MSDVNSSKEKNASVGNSDASLEMMYIDEYLREKGYSTSELDTMPESDATRLRTQASQYASLKLAELESRARLRSKIRNATDSQ